jgi:hypothetical protein
MLTKLLNFPFNFSMAMVVGVSRFLKVGGSSVLWSGYIAPETIKELAGSAAKYAQ